MAFTSATETDTLVSVHFPMGRWATEHDGVLLGRLTGQQARLELERELAGHRNLEEPVAIDFASVQAMSVAFAEGFFVPLLSGWSAGYYDHHPVVVVHAQEDVSSSLEAVLRLHGLAVLAVEGHRDGLLGGDPSLREAMQVAVVLGQFTSADIARELGVTLQAANNRLKELVRRGALIRTRVVPPGGGREYEYRVPQATAAAS